MSTLRKEREPIPGKVVGLLEFANNHVLLCELTDGSLAFQSVDFSFDPLKIIKAKRDLPKSAVIELTNLPVESVQFCQTSSGSPQISWHERLSGTPEPTIHLPVVGMLSKKPETIDVFESELWSLLLPNGGSTDQAATFTTIDSAGHDMAAIILRREKPVVIFVRSQFDGFQTSIVGGMRAWLERLRLAFAVRLTPIEKTVDQKVFDELGANGRVTFTADQTNPSLGQLHREIYRLQALLLTMQAEQQLGNQALKDPALLEHAPFVADAQTGLSGLKRLFAGTANQVDPEVVIDQSIWTRLNEAFSYDTLVSAAAEPGIDRLRQSLAISQARAEAARQQAIQAAQQPQPTQPTQRPSTPTRPQPRPQNSEPVKTETQRRYEERQRKVAQERNKIEQSLRILQTKLGGVSTQISALTFNQVQDKSLLSIKQQLKSLAREIKSQSFTSSMIPQALENLIVATPNISEYQAAGIAGPAAFSFLHQPDNNSNWQAAIQATLDVASSVIVPLYRDTSTVDERTCQRLLSDQSELKKNNPKLHEQLVKAGWRVTNLRQSPDLNLAVFCQLQCVGRIIYILRTVTNQVAAADATTQKAFLSLAGNYLTKAAFI